MCTVYDAYCIKDGPKSCLDLHSSSWPAGAILIPLFAKRLLSVGKSIPQLTHRALLMSSWAQSPVWSCINNSLQRGFQSEQESEWNLVTSSNSIRPLPLILFMVAGGLCVTFRAKEAGYWAQTQFYCMKAQRLKKPYHKCMLAFSLFLSGVTTETKHKEHVELDVNQNTNNSLKLDLKSHFQQLQIRYYCIWGLGKLDSLKKTLCTASKSISYWTKAWISTDTGVTAVRYEASLLVLFHRGALSPCSTHHSHCLLFLHAKSNISMRPPVFEGRCLPLVLVAEVCMHLISFELHC